MQWEFKTKQRIQQNSSPEDLLHRLLSIRTLITKKQITDFLVPKHPNSLTCRDVGISNKSLNLAVVRIKKALLNQEKIVVYADYDADGITAGAVLWETLHKLGADVMPYIPHRVEEGYGLSIKGIDRVHKELQPTLLITVDHGITAWEKVDYAKKLGIDVIITDHHVSPKKIPQTTIVHTTKLSGSGVSWFLAKTLIEELDRDKKFEYEEREELLALAAIGTIADMVELLGPNRQIVHFGLLQLNKTKRVGLTTLFRVMGVTPGNMTTYEVSFMIAPRLNAMGRLVHALDALRLLLTKNSKRAQELAQLLNQTNVDRQSLTQDHVVLAKQMVEETSNHTTSKIIFIAHESFNQGVIGLVAGRLVEAYSCPAIVVSVSGDIGKASARSIAGFNIIQAIRSAEDLLIDAGGHPMAAGFTIEKKHIHELGKRLQKIAQSQILEKDLIKKIYIDFEVHPTWITDGFVAELQKIAPFGVGNPRPVFAMTSIEIDSIRTIGYDGKHLKLTVLKDSMRFEAIGFQMGFRKQEIETFSLLDIAFYIDENVYQGKHRIQLILKDIKGLINSSR